MPKSKFDWGVAVIRWIKGLLVGALGGLAALKAGDGSAVNFGIDCAIGFVGAVIVDLDAFARWRKKNA